MTSASLSAIPRHPSEFACVDLVNSAFSDHLGRGTRFDRLALAEWQQWLLERHGLGLDEWYPGPRKHLRALREDIDSVLGRWARSHSVRVKDVTTLDQWVSHSALRERVKVVSGQLELVIEPLKRDWHWAMSRIALSAVDLIAGGAPERLKICDNPDCSWMFYDSTLNRSQRYCSTNPCGTVMRVRRFRSRRSLPTR